MNNHLPLRIVGLMAAFLLGLLSACTPADAPAWSKFENIPGGGWSPERQISFNPWPADSTAARTHRYDVVLSVRFSRRHHLKSLPLAISVEDDRHQIALDTLSIPLAAPSGRPLGRESLGVCQVDTTLARNVALTEGYCVSLMPIMPAKHSEGILNVGLSLREAR